MLRIISKTCRERDIQKTGPANGRGQVDASYLASRVEASEGRVRSHKSQRDRKGFGTEKH